MTHRRLRSFAALAALAMVLAACQVTITDGKTPLAQADYEFSASSSFANPVGSIVVPEGASRLIDIQVPSSLRSSTQRLVVEVDDQGTYRLDMVMFAADLTTPYASTSGGAFFAPALAGIGDGFLELPVGTRGVGTSGIRPLYLCFGPCIARFATESVVRVRVTNAAGSGSLTLPVYAFVDDFLDEGEPANESVANADVVDSANGAAGVIEVLGDRDYVAFPTTGTIAFNERSVGSTQYDFEANLRLRIVDADLVEQVVLEPGATFAVQSGWYGIVFSDPAAPRATVGGAHYVFYE